MESLRLIKFLGFLFVFCITVQGYTQSQVQTVNIQAIDQAMVNSLEPSVNYSGMSSILAETDYESGSAYSIRTFFNFNLSSIPSNAIIHSATLSLTHDYHVNMEEQYTLISFPENTWVPNDITWENQIYSPIANSIEIHGSSSGVEGVMTVDLTNRIRDLFYFPDTYVNYGFCFRQAEESPVRSSSYYTISLEVQYEVPVDLEYEFVTEPILWDDENNGSASIHISAGNPPYTYEWSDGSSVVGTAKTLQGVEAGTYALTVTDNINRDFTFEVSIGYQTDWKDEIAEHFTAYENTIEKSSGYGFNHAVGTHNVLEAGEDGWVEYTVRDIKHKMIGFSDITDYEAGYNKFLGGFYLRDDRNLRRIVQGSETSMGSYNENDIVRIEKVGTTFNYYLNGDLVGSNTNSAIASKDLLISVAIYQPNSRFQLARTSFGRPLTVQVYAENIMKSADNGEIYAIPIYGKPPYAYNWSNSATDDRIKNLSTGTYTVTVTDADLKMAIRTIDIYNDPDEAMNWQSSKSFDEKGNLLGASKSFSDYNGKGLQSQSISTRTLNVFASQPVYDSYNRPVISTLAAPTFQERLDYKSNFMKAHNGQTYDEMHFDIPNYTTSSTILTEGEQDKPYKVDSIAKGGLGWYYSDNNTISKYHDRTSYPYSRSVYAPYDPNQVVKNSAPHDKFSMGSGHESKGYLLPASGELVFMFGYGKGWTLGEDYEIIDNGPGTGGIGVLSTDMLKYNTKAYKRVSYSPEGKEHVIFYDNDGKVIASGMSGLNDAGLNENEVQVRSTISGPANGSYRYVDIHLPEGCENSLELHQPTTGVYEYDIINLITGEVVLSDFDQTTPYPPLPAGVYRIVDRTFDSPEWLGWPHIMDLHIKYKVNYYNLTLNFYDKKGQLKAVVDPNGFDNSGVPTESRFDVKQHLVGLSTVSSASDWEYFSSDANHPITTTNTKVLQQSITLPASGDLQFTNVMLQLRQNNNDVVLSNGEDTETDFESVVVQGFMGEEAVVYPESSSSTYTSNEDTHYPAGLINTGGGSEFDPDYDFPNCAGGTFVLSRNSNPCATNEQANYFYVGTGWCVSCIPTGGCQSTNKPYEVKYQMVFEINAITPSGTTHVNNVTIEAVKRWSVVLHQTSGLHWSFSTPHDQPDYNTAFPDAAVAVIDPELSKTTTAVEVKLISLKEKEPYLQAVNDCNWYTRQGFGYGTNDFVRGELFNELMLLFEVKTHKLGGVDHEISQFYDYNSVGEVIKSESVDEGETDYVYTRDGLLRFSQSAQQRADDKFSYTDYDELGRPIEMGIVDESTSGLMFQNHYGDIDVSGSDYVTHLTTLEYIQNLRDNSAVAIDGTDTEDETHIRYDVPDAGFYTNSGLPASYIQEYMRGRIAHVWNEHTATWYSYLSDGRLDWMATKVYGLGVKTIHYTYNALGSVANIIYQKDDPTDYFEHKYTYDRVGNLKRAYTRNGASANYIEEAEYKYDLQGQLIRVEVADNLQGVDYVYNTLGMLKAINSPNLGEKNHRKYFVDPGRDGKNGFKMDIFGMSFDYFKGDYSKAGTKIVSGTALNNYYDGQTAAIRWNTALDLANTDEQWSYDYEYLKTGWLKSAFFTTVGAFGNNSVPPVTTTGAMGQYSVDNITYDKNGNLQSMTRRGASAAHVNMDDFTYRYDPERPNRLALLNDNTDYSNYNTDLDDQGTWDAGTPSTWNYIYDAEGRMIEDKSEDLQYFYNGYGLVEEIKKDHGSGYVNFVKFEYNDAGLRSRKISHDDNGNELKYTWYVRDVSGAEVAQYEEVVGQSLEAPTYPLLADARLGQYDRSDDSRIYEFMDHLGNVRATFSRDATNGISINSYADYYPFGSPLPGRQLIAGDQYEHGYQGQFTERDEETGLDAFELRMWDSRLARWHSTDPYGEFHSPYIGMGNNPIGNIDPDGGAISQLASSMITGAIIGGGTGMLAHSVAGGDPKNLWKAFVGGAAIGAAAGYGFGGGQLPSFNLNISAEAGKQIAGIGGNALFSGYNGYMNVLNNIPTPSPSVDPNLLASNSGCCDGWKSYVPVIGPALISGEYLEKGDYINALLWEGYAFADLFTLGYASRAKLATFALRNAPRLSIQFGRTSNQVYHTFRHTDALGLNRRLVKRAIERHVRGNASKIMEGKLFKGSVKVSGKELQYNAFKLGDGTINVGRITGP